MQRHLLRFIELCSFFGVPRPLHPSPWPEASESWFWTSVPEPFVFSYILFSKLAILGSRAFWSSPGLSGCSARLLGGRVWALDFPWAWAPGAPWGFWASKSWFWSLAPKPHVSLTFSLANRPFLAAEAPWGFWASKSWFRGLAPKPHVSLTLSLANWPFLAAGAAWAIWASKSWFWILAPKPHVSLTFSLASWPR